MLPSPTGVHAALICVGRVSSADTAGQMRGRHPIETSRMEPASSLILTHQARECK